MIKKHSYTTTNFFRTLKYRMQSVPAQAELLFQLTSTISLGEMRILVKLIDGSNSKSLGDSGYVYID